MAKTVPWRVKGVDRKTRRMARDAAARSGVPIGVWIDRAIKSRAAIVPRGDAKPLVSPELLASARVAPDEKSTKKEPFLPEMPGRSDDAATPRVDPALAASAGRQSGGWTGRVVGGVLVVALMAGGYWLVSQGPAGGPGESETAGVAGKPDNVPAAASKEAAPPAPAPSVAAAPPQPAPEPAPLTPVQKLTAKADGGDAEAQHALGLVYLQGDGVPENPAVGAQWLTKSAETGFARAQYDLGVLYEKGLGVTRNDQAAFTWYRRAALQGHVRAQHNLGTLYAEGKGTARNYDEAMRWFTRAGKEGLAESHYSLGMMYEHGMGVEKDPRKAAAYYRDALAAGSAQAADKLARLEPALQEPTPRAARPETEPDASATSDAGEAQAPAAAKGSPLTTAGIVNLQRLLARLDLAPGPADGVPGEQTVEAIKLYQRFAGLPVDGKPTVELLRDLRQVVGAMSEDTPQQQGASRNTP